MVFKTLEKNGISRRRSWTPQPKKDRSALAGVDPKFKQIAYDKLAILREYHRRLSNPGRPRKKAEVIEKFLADANAGMLRPEGAPKFISHVCRSSLYNWRDLYKTGGLLALVPRYKCKGNPSTQRPIFRPAAKPFEMKFAGRPRRNGKAEFVDRLKRRWKWPASEYPIHLAIYYSMPIRKGIKMPRRMKMLRHEISHVKKPNLESLNAFIVDCMTGIVFRDHSQIIHFHSEKKFAWWPEIRILVREMKG